MRSSRLFHQTDKYLEVHLTNDRQNCSIHSSDCISESNNLNLKYNKQSKPCKNNRETHNYATTNFKQSNFYFNSPNFVRKSSLMLLMYMTFQVSTLFFLSLHLYNVPLGPNISSLNLPQEAWGSIETSYQHSEVFIRKTIMPF